MIILYETFKRFNSNYENDLKRYLEKFEDYDEIDFLFDIRNSYRNEIETLTEHHDFDSLALNVDANYKVNSIFKILGFIEDKIQELEPQNLDENNSFKNIPSFKSFNIYVKKHIIEPYVDYSYLFQRMLKENIIEKTKHLDFINWLFENKYIDEKNKDLFISKGNFRSLKKSYSIQRENNFNNIFDL